MASGVIEKLSPVWSKYTDALVRFLEALATRER